MLTYSIMLDGGFVKRKTGTARRPATPNDIVNLTTAIRGHALLAAHRLHRVYFYDAAPSAEIIENPFSGERIDFGVTRSYRANEAMHHHADVVIKASVAQWIGESTGS